MTIMATGSSEKVDSLINLLEKYRIIELVRTGKVVMVRGDGET
jgi:acetolactate synthase small subunit